MRNIRALGFVVLAVACSSSSSGGGGKDGGTTDSSASSSSGSSSSGSSSGGSSSGSSSGGMQCPTGETACAGQCCVNATATCVTTPTGTKLCAQTCTTSSDCPVANGCCTVVNLAGGGQGGACQAPGSVTGQQCLCSTATECGSSGHTGSTTGCCAPIANAAGNPTGPYICKPNDGKGYDCCGAGCVSGYCCVNLTQADGGALIGSICQEPCTNSSTCGGGSCTPLTTGSCNNATGTCDAP